MIKHYLKAGIRALWKNRATSVIKLAGLAVGMTCTLLIFLFVQDELSFDRHHVKQDRIYRVTLEKF